MDLDDNNSSSSDIPLDIESLRIIISSTDTYSPKLATIIPSTIIELELQFIIDKRPNAEITSDQQIEIICLKLKGFIIPSTITVLSLKVSYYGSEKTGYEDSTLQERYEILKTIISNNKNLKRKYDDIDDVNQYFIPPNVTKLILPSIDDGFIQLVPPTVTSLRLRKQVECVKLDLQLLTSVIHLEVASKDSVLRCISLPSSIQTITTDNTMRFECDLNENIRVNYIYFQQNFAYYGVYEDDDPEEIEKGRLIELRNERSASLVDSIPTIAPNLKIVSFYDNWPIPSKFMEGIEYLIVHYPINPYFPQQAYPSRSLTFKFFKIHMNDRQVQLLKLPITTTHLEIPLSHGWTTKFNFIPRSISHLKIMKPKRLDYSLENEEYEQIFIPSTVRFIRLFDNRYKSKIRIIDEQEYYLKPRNGLKKLSLTIQDRDFIFTENSLPSGLEELCIDGDGCLEEYITLKNTIPDSITKLKIPQQTKFDDSPPSLTSLDCYGHHLRRFNSCHIQDLFLRNASNWSNVAENNWPIKTLGFSSQDNHVQEIPNTVENLVLGNIDVKLTKLHNIKNLTLVGKARFDSMPDTIEILDIGDSTHKLPNILPKSLKELTLSYHDNIDRIPKKPTKPFEMKIIENYISSTSNIYSIDSYFKIWRNITLKNSIIDYLINPNDQIICELREFSEAKEPNRYFEADINPHTLIVEPIIPIDKIIGLNILNHNVKKSLHLLPSNIDRLIVHLDSKSDDLDFTNLPKSIKYIKIVENDIDNDIDNDTDNDIDNDTDNDTGNDIDNDTGNDIDIDIDNDIDNDDDKDQSPPLQTIILNAFIKCLFVSSQIYPFKILIRQGPDDDQPTSSLLESNNS
ncbi:hypothetical protein CYY_010479, partial [Polysphondylium violaceum]